ncbi:MULTISPECIES: helix-turn-helix domain-containing protein [unclassified Bradyrhizobium]|uniref:helix-turn-helix domain-containing protein n=1 Tax=unclassified Bradyrhizobium TaxID=2631580 RepID=UPI002916D381|nr:MULTISPECIES: helix-turn-helix domain-containing protein [unclassified Bradyrhizobium]
MTDTFTIGSHSDLVTDINLSPQCRTILAHLKGTDENGKRKRITNSESMLLYGVYRLSDVIFKLRQARYNIVTTVKTDEVGRKYSSYKLGEPERLEG